MSDQVPLDDDARRWLDVLRQATTQETYWTEVKAKAKQMLQDYLGDAETGLVDGQPAVRWTVVTSQRLDTAKLKTSMPDVYAEFTKPVTTRRFTTVDDKAGA